MYIMLLSPVHLETTTIVLCHVINYVPLYLNSS